MRKTLPSLAVVFSVTKFEPEYPVNGANEF